MIGCSLLLGLAVAWLAAAAGGQHDGAVIHSFLASLGSEQGFLSYDNLRLRQGRVSGLSGDFPTTNETLVERAS